MSGCTALALSQSGRTPDVVEYARQARRRGAFTVAITNDASSELARECRRGPRALAPGRSDAVAATKTYSNQVAALGLLAAHAAGEGAAFADGIRGRRRHDAAAHRVRRRRASRTSRGRSRMPGGCSSSDAEPSSPPRERSRSSSSRPVASPRSRLRPRTSRTARSRRSTRSSPCGRSPPTTRRCPQSSRPSSVHAKQARRSSRAAMRRSRFPARSTSSRAPRHRSPLLSPLLSIVPGQLFAWALSRARGLDPDSPRGLSKVTLAR